MVTLRPLDASERAEKALVGQGGLAKPLGLPDADLTKRDAVVEVSFEDTKCNQP